MAGILRDVVQRGTATRAKVLGRNDIGGKTGTTNDYKDGWFAGFHPTNVAIVWLGFDQPESLGNREYGGVVALPVWIDFMRGQLENVPQQWVSLNNRAKSKKQKQDILEVTDEGVVAVDSETGKKKAAPTNTTSTPPKPKPQQRAAPPEPDTTPSAPTASAAPTSDSVPENPLSVTPVEQMPPMPN